MTIIIGLVHDDKVYMGGDRLVTFGAERHQLGIPKLFKWGDFLIGVGGSPRLPVILQAGELLPLPEIDPSLTPLAAVLRYLVEPMNQKERELDAYKDDNTFNLLIGYRGYLFIRDKVGCVFPCQPHGFTAIGAGAEMAIGAMDALHHLAPVQRIEQALQIVFRHNVVCGGPYDILATD